ncbi:MAG TPA: OB-fold nucleic acid binding domain-containing protein [Nakamurella sp.]
MAGSFSTWIRKFTRDDDEVDADRLSGEADASGAVRAGICCQGEVVKLQGRLRYVDLRPTDSLATLVAELYDGTEGVQLIWLGRRSIPGIEPGRTVKVRGRVAIRDGRKVIYNPDYDLLPAHA